MLRKNFTVHWKVIIKVLSCIVFFLAAKFGGAKAQQNASYIFHRITQSDGLLHTSVRSIVQDGRGYIWILTPNGLQRYDGSRFVNYPYDLTSPAGIIDTRTAGLFSDLKNNCLWIVDKEVEKLDLQTNRFSLFSRDELLKNSQFHFDTYTDSLNNKWFVGDFGIFSDHSFQYMLPFYLSASFLAPRSSGIFFRDSVHGQTWMADYWQGLILFDKKTKKVYTHAYNPIHHPLLQLMPRTSLTAIMLDSRHNTWIQTNTPEFFRYDPESGKLSTYSLKEIDPLQKARDHNNTLYVDNIFEDNHHSLWISTANAGLLQYDRDEDKFISIVDEQKGQNGLYYSYGMYGIFQDRDENIWIGTDKGISIFNPYHQNFKVVRHEQGNPLSLPSEEVESFIQAKNGDILVGTWGGGITVYDKDWNFKKNIRFKAPYELNLVWSFIQSDDGKIWAGCQHGFIHIYDPATQKVETIHPPEMNNFTIHCMAKDREGNIWFGLHDGKIALWNKESRKFYPYNDKGGKIEQRLDGISTIFFDSKGRCWAGTELGLKEFNTTTRNYTGVYLPSAKNAFPVTTTIRGIEEYNDSTLIVGSLHGGLNLFNIRSKTFTHLAASDELTSNTVSAIGKDAGNNFWLTTDYSVFKFIPKGHKFVRYTIEPGLVNAPFKSTKFYALQNGEWLSATATEIIRFQPSLMDQVAAQKNKVEITGFKIFDTPLFIDSVLSKNNSVHLDYKQNFLTIEFSDLSFSNQQQTNYYYKLSGLNGDWVSAGTKKFASYTNLDPGAYTFFIKAEKGGETVATNSFMIVIAPPFWKTWWFITSLVLALGFAILFLFKKRIQAIKRQAELKQKLTETEMLALRSQMNPHFIFNCLNAIDNLIQTAQPDKATTYLARFAKLIRYLLESSKNNLVPFYKDFETLQLYLQLEQFRSSDKFTYELNADRELLQGDYKVPPLIIQPFVENAIHHGLLNKQEGERKLIVQARLKDNYIFYTISDNGVGRIKALEIKNRNKPEHKSYGIDISSERIHLHNQSGVNAVLIKDIEDKDKTGTEVQVKLKI